jgi:hypothetical protein
VLADIDVDYLQLWGHYRMLVGLHGRIRGRITDPGLNVYHLTSLGLCRYRLGEYWQVECPQARPHYPRPARRRPAAQRLYRLPLGCFRGGRWSG